MHAMIWRQPHRSTALFAPVPRAGFGQPRACASHPPTEDNAIAKPQRDQNRGRYRDMTRINDRIRAPRVRVVTS